MDNAASIWGTPNDSTECFHGTHPIAPDHTSPLVVLADWLDSERIGAELLAEMGME